MQVAGQSLLDAVTHPRAYCPNMGDVRCERYGALLEPMARDRYCRPAHRQAAWLARRRWQRAAEARAMTAVGTVSDLTGHLVQAAVPADRRAGALRAQVGAGLGITAAAARSRFGRTRGSSCVGMGPR